MDEHKFSWKFVSFVAQLLLQKSKALIRSMPLGEPGWNLMIDPDMLSVPLTTPKQGFFRNTFRAVKKKLN